MADSWSLSVAALALLGQVPSYIENGQKLALKWREKPSLSEKEATDSEIAILQSRSEWLLYRIMLLDLITAFPKGHTMNSGVLEFCRSERPRIFDEYKQVTDRLVQLASQTRDQL